jgi:hypothetical protein
VSAAFAFPPQNSTTKLKQNVRTAGTSCQLQGIAEQGCVAEGAHPLFRLVIRHCRA